MSNKKSIESRRKLLKSIAAGSGAIVAGKSLPESWSRPVVDSLMLPAHAQTSQLVYGGTDLPTARQAMTEINNDSMFADAFVSPAHAGGGGGGGSADICAILSGDMLDVSIQTQQNNARRQGMLAIDGSVGVLATTEFSSNCEGAPDDLYSYIGDYTAGSGFTLYVHYENGVLPESYMFSVYVPLGVCPNFQVVDGPCVEGGGGGGG